MLPGNTPAFFGGGLVTNDTFTVLLLHGDLTNGANKFLDVSPAKHGFAVINGSTTTTAQIKFGTAAISPSGYMAYPNSADWDFGAGDFTIDWWEWRTGAGCVLARDLPSATPAFLIGYHVGAGPLIYMSSNNSSFDIASAISMGANLTAQWVHYACVRKGSTFNIYQNGISKNTWTSALALAANPNPICIGAAQNGNNYVGYLDEFRISKGIARWTANFTPPIKAYGPDSINDLNTVLLLHMDGANAGTLFPDSSPYNKTFTRVGYTTSTANKKFGSASAVRSAGSDIFYFNGDTDFTFGTADLTIDLWINPTSITAGYLFDQRPVAEGAYLTLYMNASGKVVVRAASADRITSATTLVIGTWYHVALVRASGVTSLFINGVQEGGTYADSNNYSITTNRPILCADGMSQSLAFSGYIDEFRISKGIARWTANFTPPSAPYS